MKLEEPTQADYEAIAESIPVIVLLANSAGATTYFNTAGIRYTGVPRDVTYDWNWAALLHADDVDATWLAWEKSTRTGTTFRIDYRIRRADGVYRWHAGHAVPIRNAAGEIVLWMGTAVDIEDQKNPQTEAPPALATPSSP